MEMKNLPRLKIFRISIQYFDHIQRWKCTLRYTYIYINWIWELWVGQILSPAPPFRSLNCRGGGGIGSGGRGGRGRGLALCLKRAPHWENCNLGSSIYITIGSPLFPSVLLYLTSYIYCYQLMCRLPFTAFCLFFFYLSFLLSLSLSHISFLPLGPMLFNYLHFLCYWSVSC